MGVVNFKKRGLPEETPLERLEDELEDLEQSETLGALTDHVRKCYREATEHKQKLGVDRDILYALRAVRNEYSAEELARFEGYDVYMGVTNLKVRAFKSWVTDILMNAEDQPWTLKPTPSPDLPSDLQEAIIKRLEIEVQQSGYSIDIERRARELKKLAQKYIDKASTEAATRMEMKIKDDLLQGNWRVAFDEFVTDLAMFPCAIIKGPFLVKRPGIRWQGTVLETVDGFTKSVERVDPWDFFPSPNSTDCQDGAYVIERMKLTYDDVFSYIEAPGFDELGIRAALAHYEMGYRHHAFRDSTKNAMDGLDDEAPPPDETYEVLVYTGRIAVDLLQQHGLAYDLDPQKRCEAEIWVLGEYVIKAMMNPHPLGRRPYYATSFQKVPGAFWGISLPVILKDIQAIANASARDLVRNMGYASGPIVEVDAKRMSSEGTIDEIQPWRIYYTDNDALATNTQPAMKFNVVPVIAKELLVVLDTFSDKADNVSGIPAYVMGGANASGAGRTLGGLSMLMGNAAKGVKQVISNIDRYIIEPVLTEYYTLEMMFGEDDSMKADAKIIARGSVGILQRELNQARTAELLQILPPFLPTGVVTAQTLSVVIRDYLKSLGYNPDEYVKDPDREQELAALAQQQQLASQVAQETNTPLQGVNLAPPGPTPQTSELDLPANVTLDGRSVPAPDPSLADKLPG